MRHLFVLNPLAFKDDAEIDHFKKEVDRQLGGAKKYDIMVSRYARDAVCSVYRYLSRCGGDARVYAVGGDSILRDCLNGMASFPSAELASLPHGIFPAFLRSVPHEYEAFSQIGPLVSAKATPTDIIDLDGTLALNACVVGLPATIGRMSIQIPDSPAAIRGTRRSSADFMLRSYRSILNTDVATQNYRITLDGHSFDGRYAAIVTTNGPCFFPGKLSAPQAKPTDGLLDVMLIKSSSTLKLMSILPDYLSGKHQSHIDCIVYTRAESIEISSERPIYMSIDSEVQIDMNISLRVAAGAIRFAAPEGLGY